ncbi:hypothetical protein M0R45_024599 [Rubus argutus]|uniref:Sodium/metabolite cotransporter BASS6, chloroplastic n=1 Tax=Rubus argutus TaxID=59490 RepID=A0AAW1WTP5_RUBAR
MIASQIPPPPNLSFNILLSPSLRFSLRSPSISPLCRCASDKSSDSFDLDLDQNYASEPPQIPRQNKVSFVELLKNQVLFTPCNHRQYAVGSCLSTFFHMVYKQVLCTCIRFLDVCSWVGIFGLPTPVGAGIMLVSCVSGAQLSNYATFLTDPPMAPLSIVMTSLSTATAIVVTPIAAGLLLNRYLPQICDVIRPLLPPLSVLVTACCVGAPLAINIESVLSPFGLTILLLIITFHMMAFIAGYFLTGMVFHEASDVKALQRTLSYETGMQSSLLALALANRFFQDPLVGVPPAISTVIMSLMGFSLVMVWTKRKE